MPKRSGFRRERWLRKIWTEKLKRIVKVNSLTLLTSILMLWEGRLISWKKKLEKYTTKSQLPKIPCCLFRSAGCIRRKSKKIQRQWTFKVFNTRLQHSSYGTSVFSILTIIEKTIPCSDSSFRIQFSCCRRIQNRTVEKIQSTTMWKINNFNKSYLGDVLSVGIELKNSMEIENVIN
jgi:hypothetical protein